MVFGHTLATLSFRYSDSQVGDSRIAGKSRDLCFSERARRRACKRPHVDASASASLSASIVRNGRPPYVTAKEVSRLRIGELARYVENNPLRAVLFRWRGVGIGCKKMVASRSPWLGKLFPYSRTNVHGKTTLYK